MSDDEERWHVRIAPGEIKVLTLEQIDDLFRLEMIDENTLLRQHGSEEWLPLRVVAGLDEEEAPAPPPRVLTQPGPPPQPPPRSQPPPAPTRSQSPPPVVRSQPPTPPPPVVRSRPPAPPTPPPPPVVRSQPPTPPPPIVSSQPPSSQAPTVRRPATEPPPLVMRSQPPPLAGRGQTAPPPPPAPLPPPPQVEPFSTSPSFAPPPVGSLPPRIVVPAVAGPMVVPTVAPALVRAQPARRSRAELLLIGLAAAFGLLVVLHRNGVVAQLFASAGQSAAYEGFEAALGGPGFGTPRAVEAQVKKTSLQP